MNKFLFVLIGIIFFIVLLVLSNSNYENTNSGVLINKYGVFKTYQKDVGRFGFQETIENNFGGHNVPDNLHTRLSLKKYGLDFNMNYSINFDCGKYVSINFKYANYFLQDYVIVGSLPKPIIFDTKGRFIGITDEEIFLNETITEFEKNSLCYIKEKEHNYYLEILFINKPQKEFHLPLKFIHLPYSYDLMDYFGNKILISLYEVDRGKVPYITLENLTAKSYLCSFEDNSLQIDELPVDNENAKMIASSIGKDVVIYFDHSQKDVFSYRVLDLKTRLFSKKFSININGVSNYPKHFYYNDKEKQFIINKGVTWPKNEIITFKLYSNELISRPENDF